MYIRRKLSDEQILDIKEKYKSGLYLEKELAAEYGVCTMTISLWLQDDPYSIIKKKRIPKVIYTEKERCPICTRVIEDENGNIHECDCQKPRKYFSDAEDLQYILQNQRKSFYK